MIGSAGEHDVALLGDEAAAGEITHERLIDGDARRRFRPSWRMTMRSA